MKKALYIAVMMLAATAPAAVQTNWVYVVSNIYIRTSEVRYVTNRVQNTHYNYYFTNNVTTITNIWTVNHTTNFHNEVVNTNFGPWIVAASNQANRAAEGAVAATNMANVAAGHATTAGGYSSSARSYASQAQAYRNQTQAAADAGLSNINARIAWFDAHAGETITMVTTNINMTVDPSLSFPYTSPGGTTYENVRHYPLENANGKVCATPTGSYYPGTALFLFYTPRYGNSYAVGCTFVYDIGYVSSDANGMLVRYVVRKRTLGDVTAGGDRKLILPRDCYWQDGSYFAVFDLYNTSTNWIGRWKVGCNIQSSFPFPDNIYAAADDNYWQYSNYPSLQTVSRTDFSGHPYNTGSNVPFKTEKGSMLSSLLPLWIQATPTSDQQATLDWINTFPHQ